MACEEVTMAPFNSGMFIFTPSMVQEVRSMFLRYVLYSSVSRRLLSSNIVLSHLHSSIILPCKSHVVKPHLSKVD